MERHRPAQVSACMERHRPAWYNAKNSINWSGFLHYSVDISCMVLPRFKKSFHDFRSWKTFDKHAHETTRGGAGDWLWWHHWVWNLHVSYWCSIEPACSPYIQLLIGYSQSSIEFNKLGLRFRPILNYLEATHNLQLTFNKLQNLDSGRYIEAVYVYHKDRFHPFKSATPNPCRATRAALKFYLSSCTIQSSVWVGFVFVTKFWLPECELLRIEDPNSWITPLPSSFSDVTFGLHHGLLHALRANCDERHSPKKLLSSLSFLVHTQMLSGDKVHCLSHYDGLVYVIEIHRHNRSCKFWVSW
jgi:hypothetical protein